MLRLAASLEQASQHVVAAAIVTAAISRGLTLDMPDLVRETMGSGLEGKIAGRIIKAGSRQLVCGPGTLDAWLCGPSAALRGDPPSVSSSRSKDA